MSDEMDLNFGPEPETLATLHEKLAEARVEIAKLASGSALREARAAAAECRQRAADAEERAERLAAEVTQLRGSELVAELAASQATIAALRAELEGATATGAAWVALKKSAADAEARADAAEIVARRAVEQRDAGLRDREKAQAEVNEARAEAKRYCERAVDASHEITRLRADVERLTKQVLEGPDAAWKRGHDLGRSINADAVVALREDVRVLEAKLAIGGMVVSRLQEPLALRLPCPGCGELHVDEGEFATKVHHTHACQHCGEVWRPAVAPTVGVRFLPGFKNVEPSAAELLAREAARREGDR